MISSVISCSWCVAIDLADESSMANRKPFACYGAIEGAPARRLLRYFQDPIGARICNGTRSRNRNPLFEKDAGDTVVDHKRFQTNQRWAIVAAT
jgi:hypothetical protein